MIRDRGAVVAYLSLTLVMLFWAGNAIVGRAMRADIPPFTFAFLRWTFALALLLPLAAPHLKRDRAALAAGWKIVLPLGVLGVGVFNGFLYLGLHYTNATNAMLLQAATPAGVLLMDRLLFAQRAPATRILGIVLSTLGVIVVVIRGDIGVIAGLKFGFGDMLVLAAVLAWSLYTSLLRAKPSVNPLSLLSATFLIGALCMAPFAAGEWVAGMRPRVDQDVIAAVFYVAIFPSTVSFLMFNRAVGQIGAGRAGQTISLMPLFGAVIAAAALNEPLHDYHLAGMVLIFGGIAFALWMERRGTIGAGE